MSAMRYVSISFAFALGGCANGVTPVQFQQGQLFCAEATAAGPLIIALENNAGVPVNVTGKESATVAAACAAWNASAIPVTPPANATPASVPSVAVKLTPTK